MAHAPERAEDLRPPLKSLVFIVRHPIIVVFAAFAGATVADRLMSARDKPGEPAPRHPTPDDQASARPPATARTRFDLRTWKYVTARTLRSFSAHQCMDAAAGLTYYAVLSVFPALIAIFSLLGVFGQSGEAADAVLGIIEEVAPGDTAQILRGPIEQFAQAPEAGLALVTGIVLSLWSASGYVGAFSRALNRTYDVQEGRPFWKLRPMQLLVTVITVISLVIVAAVLVLSGPVVTAVGRAIGASETAQLVWSILKWPLLLFVVIMLVAVLYRTVPNVKLPRFRWISVGSVLAIVVLALGTLAFGLYVSNLSNYGRTYGSFAGVIVFLLWLWIANLALLFGAEFDAEAERARQLRAGLESEDRIQLALRDSHQSAKSAEKDREDVAEGRRIRLGSPDRPPAA